MHFRLIRFVRSAQERPTLCPPVRAPRPRPSRFAACLALLASLVACAPLHRSRTTEAATEVTSERAIAARESGVSPERFERLTRTLARHVEDGRLAGVASLVARDGEVVHFAATGLRDREQNLPLTRDTIFRIYSMTKPIASVAAMILVERGELLLGDPVSKYIPELAGMKVLRTPDSPLDDVVPSPREMTVRDLLTHTSGLASSLPGIGTPKAIEAAYAARDLRGSQTKLAPDEWIRRLAAVPLVHPPGTKFLYGASTDVLGLLVAVVSGKPLGVFLRDEIFEPLGMRDTAFSVPPEKQSRFAVSYGPLPEGGIARVDIPDPQHYLQPPAFESGAGGLVSTIDDYLRFSEMLRRGGELDGVRILSRKSIELMTVNHLTPSERDVPMLARGFPGQGFGLGFSVLESIAPGQTLGSIGQYGWGGAAGTYFWVDPEEALVVILMIQLYPPTGLSIIPELKNGVYQAIVD